MKGILLHFDAQLNEGSIAGDDGKRYSFFGQEWKEGFAPQIEQRVIFVVNELGQATAIYCYIENPKQTNVSTLASHTNDRLETEEQYGFFDWSVKCLKNYINFSGRARRKEYWYFVLFQILVGLVLGLVLGIFNASESSIDIFSTALQLFFILPSLAVTVRRLHDVDRSGWWYLLVFTIIGIIPILIWLASNTKTNSNQWGDPAK